MIGASGNWWSPTPIPNDAGKYLTTVRNGYGSALYSAAQSVTVTSRPLPGLAFSHWTFEPDVTDFSNGSATSRAVSFNMPANDVIATANYIPATAEAIEIIGRGRTNYILNTPAFDPTGFNVRATFDGETLPTTTPLTLDMISGWDSSVLNNNLVLTVTHLGQTAELDVRITETGGITTVPVLSGSHTDLGVTVSNASPGQNGGWWSDNIIQSTSSDPKYDMEGAHFIAKTDLTLLSEPDAQLIINFAGAGGGTINHLTVRSTANSSFGFYLTPSVSGLSTSTRAVFRGEDMLAVLDNVRLDGSATPVTSGLNAEILALHVDSAFWPSGNYTPRFTISGITITHTEIIDVTVNTPPVKTDYAIGDALDLTGFTLKVDYEDGSHRIVPVTADMVFGFSTTVAPGNAFSMDIRHRGFDLTQPYTVLEPASISNRDLILFGGDSIAYEIDHLSQAPIRVRLDRVFRNGGEIYYYDAVANRWYEMSQTASAATFRTYKWPTAQFTIMEWD
jgi:hypothetical protein